ncbi:universal stress protein [Flavobacterium sp.]|uniref:universal stress protein n=1 Tax=Flavobacterium sp. TaxID=239 RepID=UPI0008BDA344|nr:universal stress protein [Flavobacterium sp.]OGS64867.1 MAG: universal stress protein UspA [Flavobacteria bacterium GWA2_35_26]HCF03552.1 universal stress protein UspA [Flavobacterium sp.]
MKKILFPTDFSEVANNAFVHALEFAKMVHGELVLLHSFELPIYDNQFFPENYAAIYDSVELSEFEMFKNEIPKLRAIAESHHLDKIKMSHRLKDGDLVSAIKESIADDAIDCLVIGTSGATGWESFFIGTNASSIITDAGIPVYCVPSDAPFQKIDTIGFTTRFRPKDKKALQTVLQLAHKAKAKVKCLYVKTSNSDVSNATIAEWKEEFKSEPIDFYIIEDDDVQVIITDFIMYKEVDILIMLPYKRGFFEGLFHTSLTKKLATDFEIPILSIPINE